MLIKMILGSIFILYATFLFGFNDDSTNSYKVETKFYSPVNGDTLFQDYSVAIAESSVFFKSNIEDLAFCWVNDTLYYFIPSTSRLTYKELLSADDRDEHIGRFFPGYPPGSETLFQNLAREPKTEKLTIGDTVFFIRDAPEYNTIDSFAFVKNLNDFYMRFTTITDGIERFQEVKWTKVADTIIPHFDVSKLKPKIEKVEVVAENANSISKVEQIDPKNISGLEFTRPDGVRSKISYDSTNTLIHFWYVGCTYCTKVHPMLNKYSNTEGVAVFSLSKANGGNMAKIKKYINSFRIRAHVGMLDANYKGLRELGINSYPTIFLYNKETNEIFQLDGYNDGLGGAIEEFLGKEYE